MSRVLVDTSVILDVLLDRHPHVEPSASVWRAIETGTSEGLLAAHAITTIHCLVQKELGVARAKRLISEILRVFRVAAVDSAVIEEALRLSLADFEDAVTAAAARSSGCDYIVTRDPRGFRGSSVRPLAPEAALPMLGLE
jgi:predicted nucleic acid-binding protein